MYWRALRKGVPNPSDCHAVLDTLLAEPLPYVAQTSCRVLLMRHPTVMLVDDDLVLLTALVGTLQFRLPYVRIAL